MKTFLEWVRNPKPEVEEVRCPVCNSINTVYSEKWGDYECQNYRCSNIFSPKK